MSDVAGRKCRIEVLSGLDRRQPDDTRKWVLLTDNRMPMLQGKYKVAHFDGKADANEFFSETGVPTTFFLTTFY